MDEEHPEGTRTHSEVTLWFQAQQEILTLQRANHRLRSVKICLKQQRDAYVRQIAKRSGEMKTDA